MKELGLLAVVVATLAGCANAPGTESENAKKERLAQAYTPVGTAIPRRTVAHNPAPVTEVDKQALENERAMGARTLNGR